jgi:Pectate lyase
MFGSPWPPSAPRRRSGCSAGADQDHTTIVGLDKRATLHGGWLDGRGTSTVRRQNIIIRNITFEDVYDCFPAWAPDRNADGTWPGTGEWNAEYDAISLRETERVWIDHNEFRDRKTVDARLPTFFNELYQIHDGLVDVTNASRSITTCSRTSASWGVGIQPLRSRRHRRREQLLPDGEERDARSVHRPLQRARDPCRRHAA